MTFSTSLTDVGVAYKKEIGLDVCPWLKQEVDEFLQNFRQEDGDGISGIIRFFEDAAVLIRYQQHLMSDKVLDGFFFDVKTILDEREGVDKLCLAKLQQYALENNKETAESILRFIMILSNKHTEGKYKRTLGMLKSNECYQLIEIYKSYCLYQKKILDQLFKDDYFYVPLLKDFIDGTCKFISGFVDAVAREEFIRRIALLSRSTKNLYDFFLQYDAIMKPLLLGTKSADILTLLSPLLSTLTQKLNPRIKITNIERKLIELPEDGCFLTFMHHMRLAYLTEKLQPYLSTQQRELLMSLFCYLRSTDASSVNIPRAQQLISDILQRPHLLPAELLAMSAYTQEAIAANQGISVKANGVLNGLQKQCEGSSTLSSMFGVFKSVTHDSRLMTCLDLYRHDRHPVNLAEDDVAKNRRTIDGIVSEIFASALDVYHISNLTKLLPQYGTEAEIEQLGMV